MTSIREAIRRRFSNQKPLKQGIYHYQAPPHAEFPYRLHLRIEPGGEGVLILDASTVLHLNQTAAEFAYYLIKETPVEGVVSQMAGRYQITNDRIQKDFQEFKDRIFALIDIPDLDPVSFLEFERDTPYSGEISAPYRLDCASTYQLPEGADPAAAPTKRVDRELSTVEWADVMDKAWAAGIPHIVFTGGEPTLRSDLPELIAHAETNGQVTGLLTDGVKLADVDYFKTLLGTGLDHLMIMLNPDDEQVWRALDIILPEDLFTTIHITITQDEKTQISQVIAKLADLGANAISLSSNSVELDDIMSFAREVAAEKDLPLVWIYLFHILPVTQLRLRQIKMAKREVAGKAWLYVEPDGDVLPTQGINQVLGNLVKENWES